MAVIEKGKRNVEILKQGQNSPLPVENQVAIIYLGTKGLINAVPVNKIKEFETEFLAYMESKHQDVLDGLKAGKLDENITSTIEKAATELTAKYSS